MINSNNIPSVFKSSSEKYRDFVAFNYFDDSWKVMTYGDFFTLSDKIAGFLALNGLKKGDRVAVVSENRPEWCAAYMAVLMCGCIAVPIDAQLGSDELNNLFSDSEARAVFYSSKTETNVINAIEGSGIKGINFDGLAIHNQGYSELSSGSPEISEDDIASIIYTSGTTGKPKGVMLSHRNFCSDAAAVIQSGLVSHDDNVLSILPLHHTYSFMCTFVVPVFQGAVITFSPGLKSSQIISAIKERNVTIVVSVPRLLEMIASGILSKIKESGISAVLSAMLKISGALRKKLGINTGKIVFKAVHKNFPKVKFFASGGAKLYPSVMNDMESLGFKVLEGYGLTETSPVITFNPADKRKSGSAGKALPGVDIRIAHDGEIMAKGPMVMKGYYRNPSATSEIIKDGWLFTGDTGHLDEEGYLFITGRKKEVIVLSSGKNIYPEDVENAYMSIPLIKELCVIPSVTALTDGEAGLTVPDSLHAVIVPDLDHAKKELIGNIAEALKWQINSVSMRLPEHMRIKGFTLHSEPLPRTRLGKLKRFMVQGLAAAKSDESVQRKEDKSLLDDETGRRVVECIKPLMPEDIPVQSSDNLELDLGFDSLKRIEFISSLEAMFNISLPETFISEVQTVGDVVEKLKTGVVIGKAKSGALLSWKDILQKEPPGIDSKGTVFSFGKIETMLIYILFMLQKIFFKLFYRLNVEGASNIPEKGAFVIAPNHVSHLDGFVIAASVPFKTFKNLYFLGFQKYFAGDKIRSCFARASHVIPVDPDTYLHAALQMSAYVLRNEKAICVFPEGGRSFDGNLMEFKKGIGALSVEMRASVVPAFIKGTFKALPKGAWFLKRSKITVRFGLPVASSDIDFSLKHEKIDAYQFYANELRKKVAELSNG